MNIDKLYDLEERLADRGCLHGNNRDLIDDAIFAAKNGSPFRAEMRLKTLAANLGKEDPEAAKMVERLI